MVSHKPLDFCVQLCITLLIIEDLVTVLLFITITLSHWHDGIEYLMRKINIFVTFNNYDSWIFCFEATSLFQFWWNLCETAFYFIMFITYSQLVYFGKIISFSILFKSVLWMDFPTAKNYWMIKLC